MVSHPATFFASLRMLCQYNSLETKETIADLSSVLFACDILELSFWVTVVETSLDN